MRGREFEEVAFVAGVALGENGEAEAGMGVDAADYDGDGWPDLYMTHLDFEFDRLYRNARDGTFVDATFEDGIGYKTFEVSGFGTRFVDYDNDGWRDLFVANGHVLDNIELFHEGTRYEEKKLVFRNIGGKFEGVGERLGEAITRPRVSRAAAFADYDNDGDTDVLVANNGQEPQLLRNDGGNRNNWVQVAVGRAGFQPRRRWCPRNRYFGRTRSGRRAYGRGQLSGRARSPAALWIGRPRPGRAS